MIVLIAHLPSNNYDGYAPHRHIMLLDWTKEEYFRLVTSKGLVYPLPYQQDVIRDPTDLPWVQQNTKFSGGYRYKQPVDKEHRGMYAFGDYHDGLDVAPFDDNAGPGKFVTFVKGTALNRNGYHASAAIFELVDGTQVDCPAKGR